MVDNTDLVSLTLNGQQHHAQFQSHCSALVWAGILWCCWPFYRKKRVDNTNFRTNLTVQAVCYTAFVGIWHLALGIRRNRSDKISTASSQKKYSRGLEDLVHVFGKLTKCDVWKQKTQILIAHQKEGIDRTKKVRLETRGFCTYFLLLTTPSVMFEWKKLEFLLLIRRKE